MPVLRDGFEPPLPAYQTGFLPLEERSLSWNDRTRTCNTLLVRQGLSRLSYIPVFSPRESDPHRGLRKTTCYPLHQAKAAAGGVEPPDISRYRSAYKGDRPDSNRQVADPQSAAVPIEPQPPVRIGAMTLRAAFTDTDHILTRISFIETPNNVERASRFSTFGIVAPRSHL